MALSASATPATSERVRLLQRGLRLAGASVGWNILEGVIALAAGTAASSVALIVFGVDSFIETASGGVLLWRLRSELRSQSAEAGERVERRAARIAGVLLWALALYLLIDAGARLLGWGQPPHESLPGMILTAFSLFAMPVLGIAKLRTARKLSSRALRADAYETITCAWLSLATLGGLVLNAAFGWWWADPAAALLMLPLILREGWEGWRGGCRCEEH